MDGAWLLLMPATMAVDLQPGPDYVGAIARVPRDEIYLFQIKYSFEKFSSIRSYRPTRIQLYHYIPMLCLVSGPTTATDFSTRVPVC